MAAICIAPAVVAKVLGNNQLITSPTYMPAGRLSDAAAEIEKAVQAVMEMLN